MEPTTQELTLKMEQLSQELTIKRLVKCDGDGSLRAFCDLAIGNLFLIKGLRVVQGKHGLFVSMPRQQGRDGKWYDNVVALSAETKAEVGRVVLDAYQQDPR